MKILIDTLALEKPKTPEARYWNGVLRELLSQLRKHDVYLLIRPGYRLQSVESSATVLQASSYDPQQPVLEDRRLAALCGELEIDVFLSTLHTTAGGKVRSVLVCPDSAPNHSRAARLASARLHNPTTNEIVDALLNTVQSRLDEEEKELNIEAERLRKASLEHAEQLWAEAMKPVPLMKRIFKAVKSVQRYPEYFRRLGRLP